jgi:HTH-type transcriptional regulator/antitoxin HigA
MEHKMNEIDKILPAWNILKEFLKTPKNDNELDQLINFCNILIDATEGHEEHELFDLINIVGLIIHEYELKNIPEPEPVSPIEFLKFLMKEHNLKQKDLIEIGSPGVISEVLNGKRELNKRQIIDLSNRFHVNPCHFIMVAGEWK